MYINEKRVEVKCKKSREKKHKPLTFDSLQKLLHYIYDCWLHIRFIVKYKMEYSM